MSMDNAWVAGIPARNAAMAQDTALAERAIKKWREHPASGEAWAEARRAWSKVPAAMGHLKLTQAERSKMGAC